MDSRPENDSSSPPPTGSVVYFDGMSSRRHSVNLTFGDGLEIHVSPDTVIQWSYFDIRRADGPAGTLRLSCRTGPALARLEIRDATIAAELTSRCGQLDENVPGRHRVAAIVGWSLAAAVSIVGVVLFGVPLAADRLAPLVPEAFERRLGDVADGQVKALFGGQTCYSAAGQAAFAKLVKTVRPRGSTHRSKPPCCRHPSPMRSRCPAARFMCSMACWRKRKTRTRSRVSWRTSSAI